MEPGPTILPVAQEWIQIHDGTTSVITATYRQVPYTLDECIQNVVEPRRSNPEFP